MSDPDRRFLIVTVTAPAEFGRQRCTVSFRSIFAVDVLNAYPDTAFIELPNGLRIEVPHTLLHLTHLDAERSLEREHID